MRWITFASNPERMAKHLASAQEHAPRMEPHVLFYAKDELEFQAFADAGAPFAGWARWYCIGANPGTHLLVNNILCLSRASGTPEPYVLFTTDAQRFVAKPDLHAVHAALEDHQVAGVDLMLGLGEVEAEERVRMKKTYWRLRLPPAFHFGTVYRVADVSGPLFSVTWDDYRTLPETMEKVGWTSTKPYTAVFNKHFLEE